MHLLRIDEVAAAIGLGGHELVALVGGGGKTTTLFALGRALGGRAGTGRVVLTTTTKMSSQRTEGLPVLCNPAMSDIAAIAGPTLVWQAEDGPKALGVPPGSVDAWFDAVDHVVVEADGARRHPFKAPANYEPVIPARTTTVIAMIGADALDQVISERCHRPVLVAAVAGCGSDDRLTPERAARVLLSGDGSRKSVPCGARFVVVVTKVGDNNESSVARLVSALNGRVDNCVTVAFDPSLHPHA